LTLFVDGDFISQQIERLLGEVYKVGCPQTFWGKPPRLFD